MPRQAIAMTAAEVAAFLAARRRCVVGTRDPAGWPDGEPALLAVEDGAVTVAVARGGAAHRNLAADPRIVCSVEEFPDYAHIRGVTVLGRAVPAGETEGRVRFRIADARVESFDFAKMRRMRRE